MTARRDNAVATHSRDGEAQGADGSSAPTSGTVAPGRLSGRRLSALIAGTGTVIGLLTAATSLFDWFDAKVGTPPPAPPAEIDARVIGVDLRSRSERLVDYLEATGQPTAGLGRYEGAEQGLVFAVRLRLRGNQGNPVALRWSLVDARSGDRLRDRLYTQVPVVFRPRGSSQARTWPVWVPKPPHGGRFRLRVTLLDGRRRPLDEDESDAVTLEAGSAT